MLYIVRYQRRIKSIIANNDGETSTLRDSIPAKCSVTRRSISLSINWMAPPVVSPPPIRLVEYSSVGYSGVAWTVSHEKLTPGPGRGGNFFSRGKLSNWLVKSAKVYMLPGWMDFRFRVPSVNVLFRPRIIQSRPLRLYNPMGGGKMKEKERKRNLSVNFLRVASRKKKSCPNDTRFI